MKFNTGQIVKVKEFAFNNKKGGTELSDMAWRDRPKYDEAVQVKVTKEWEDYECGQRGHAVPHEDEKLSAYLKKYAGKAVIYISEFDVVEIEGLK